MFRSQSFRDVVYDTQPATQRQVAHRHVAHWLKAQGDLWEGGYAELAGHLDAGGEQDEARPFHVKTARQASGVFANQEAVAASGRAQIRRELALILRRLGVMTEAVEAQAQAEQDLRAAGTIDGALVFAELDLERAIVFREFGHVGEAMQALERGLKVATQYPTSIVQVDLLQLRASQRTDRHEVEQARQDCLAALTTAEILQLRDRRWHTVMANVYDTLGKLNVGSGQLEEAERHFRMALDSRHAAADNRGKLMALINLGAIAFYRADYRAAVDSYRRALAESEKIHWFRFIAISANNLGQAYLADHEMEQAVRHLERAIELSREGCFLQVLADSERALAEACIKMGEPQRALDAARDAIENAEKSGSLNFEAAAHAAAMESLLSGAEPEPGRSRCDEAHRHLDAALRILHASGLENADKEIGVLTARFARMSQNLVDATQGANKGSPS